MSPKLALAWLAFFAVGPLILLGVFVRHAIKKFFEGGTGSDPLAVQRLEAALAAANGDTVR